MPSLRDILLVASAIGTSVSAQSPDFTGQGLVYVVKSESLETASFANRIGCLGVTGAVVTNDCAIFNVSTNSNNPTLTTKAGACTFTDSHAPTGPVGTTTNNAYHCGSSPYVPGPFLYPVSNKMTFLCNRDQQCFYYVSRQPDSGERIPLFLSTYTDHPSYLQANLIWDHIDHSSRN